jgi:SAM-dependent methyltransferase
MPDASHGYEELADEFMRRRDDFIGKAEVRQWAGEFAPGAEVLELGCGHGVISQVLVDAGVTLSAVDASPSLLRAFRERFPGVETECAAAEAAMLMGRAFGGILAWGLIFLLEEDQQRTVLSRAARALRPGGRLLFTAPIQVVEWIDIMTRQPSRSLGVDEYERILRNEGLEVSWGVRDEGENHYYFARKAAS